MERGKKKETEVCVEKVKSVEEIAECGASHGAASVGTVPPYRLTNTYSTGCSTV